MREQSANARHRETPKMPARVPESDADAGPPGYPPTARRCDRWAPRTRSSHGLDPVRSPAEPTARLQCVPPRRGMSLVPPWHRGDPPGRHNPSGEIDLAFAAGVSCVICSAAVGFHVHVHDLRLRHRYALRFSSAPVSALRLANRSRRNRRNPLSPRGRRRSPATAVVDPRSAAASPSRGVRHSGLHTRAVATQPHAHWRPFDG